MHPSPLLFIISPSPWFKAEPRRHKKTQGRTVLLLSKYLLCAPPCLGVSVVQTERSELSTKINRENITWQANFFISNNTHGLVLAYFGNAGRCKWPFVCVSATANTFKKSKSCADTVLVYTLTECTPALRKRNCTAPPFTEPDSFALY